MNKYIKAFCLLIALSVCAFAQTNADDYKKNEYFVGFSTQQVDKGIYQNHNGFEVSYVRNLNRYLGAKADFSGAYRNDTFQGNFQPVFGGATTSFRTANKNSLYNFLGGVQLKDNASKARLKPFAHALAGVGYSRTNARNTFNNTTSQFTYHSTGFAAALGGGLDIKINERIDFRAIQVDYNPVRNFGQFNHNVRFGIGIVIK